MTDQDGNKVYTDIQVYQDDCGCTHISFDYDIIGSEIIYNPRTHKYSLFKSCVVFQEHTDNYLDNYLW